MNRCLTEGRQAFGRRLEGIERGLECERLSPELSRLADGTRRVEDLERLRRHLCSCLTCRARLRVLRTAKRTRTRGATACGRRCRVIEPTF